MVFRKSVFFSLPLFLLLLAGEPSAFAANATAVGDEVAADFSDYVPETSREDAYDEDSYMYFGKSFMVSLGSGVNAWTGVWGKLYKAALPTLDFRLSSLSDRSAWEFSLNVATHYGAPAQFEAEDISIVVPDKLRTFQYSVAYKYYIESDVRSFEGTTASTAACPFFGLGLSFTESNFDFTSFNTTQHSKASPPVGLLGSDLTFSMPILGEMPFPVPFLEAGADFALNAQKSSVTLEGRWLPVGTIANMFAGEQISPALDKVFHEKSVGDMLSFSLRANFVF